MEWAARLLDAWIRMNALLGEAAGGWRSAASPRARDERGGRHERPGGGTAVLNTDRRHGTMARRRPTLKEVVQWLLSSDTAASREEIEDEARRQASFVSAQGPGQGRIWCKDEEEEAEMAGRVAGIWTSERWKAGRRGGHVNVLLPHRDMRQRFANGMMATLEGCGVPDIEQSQRRVLVRNNQGNELEFDVRGVGAARAGYGRSGTLQAAFLCGTARRSRGYKDAVRGVQGSMSQKGSMLWFFASIPALWDSRGGSTPLPDATDALFWDIAGAGKMYAKRLV